MSNVPFTIRIKSQEQDMDLLVRPEEVPPFRQILDIVSEITHSSAITAFDYEDEDGDKITVKSDDDMKEMVSSYFGNLSDADIASGLLPPLSIFPKAGKTPQIRNVLNLKVKTDKQANQADKKSSVDIKNILACGNIAETDLQYDDLLGTGNSGKVYKATHKPSGITIAVKVIQLDVDLEIQRQIISELKILYRCNSSVIIGFYGAFFLENRISICTEYMDGGSLDKFGQIPEPILGRMTIYIIQGLLYVWSLKILHRDIKPSNILANTQGHIKLCDFGVSRQLAQSIATTYVGTNAYMAPERIKGQDYGTPSEVWSLGLSLFELATKKFPYEEYKVENRPMQLLNSIVDEMPPVLPADSFSPQFVNFVQRCMQQQPQHRLMQAELTSHPFIQQYNDRNVAVIASWIQSQLQLQKR